MHRLRTDANPRSQSGIPSASPTDDRRLIRVLGLVLMGTGAFDMGQHAMGAAFGVDIASAAKEGRPEKREGRTKRVFPKDFSVVSCVDRQFYRMAPLGQFDGITIGDLHIDLQK